MFRAHRYVHTPAHRPAFAISFGLAALATSTFAYAADQTTVEEVVVTASRREQAVQNVAAAVAVINPNDFASGGNTSLADVLAYVPGVNYNDNGAPGLGSITMRGVANIFSTPSVGIYVDDIPYGSVTAFAEGANQALDSLLGDIERVEVIKGPQGTLFGSSSMGGSLRYITKEPSLTDVRGHVSADLSNTEEGGFNQLYKGGVSVPLVRDKLALSVNGFYQDESGFIDEAVRPLKDVNSAKLKGGTATLLFQPTDPFKIKASYTNQKFEFDNQNAVPFDFTTGEPTYGKYTKNSATDEPTAIDFELSSLTFDYDFGFATATLASSYQEFSRNAVSDLTPFFGGLIDSLTGVSGNVVLLNQTIATDRWAHEFRLTSANNEQLEWLVGAYYTDESSTNIQNVEISPAVFDLVHQQFPSTYREWAGFGDLTYYWSPKFDTTLGVRYSSNDMSVVYTGTGLVAGPNLPKSTVSDDVTTYLFNARYRPNQDVSLYARIANGYRPASANLSLIDPSTGEILSPPFIRSDSLWSYEVGAKGRALQGTLQYDLAVYYLKWKDMQIFKSFLGSNVGSNADSDVSANGVELTLAWQPFNGLNLVGSTAYASSELDHDDPSIGGLSGEQLPGIPEWTFSLQGTYTFPLSATLDAFVGAGVTYMDKRKTSFNGGTASDGTVIAPTNPNYTVGDYTKADLRLGVTFGKYQVSLYAINLFNEYAYQTAVTNSAFGTATILQPRTMGAVLTAQF